VSSIRLDQELVKRRMMPSRSGARHAILDGLISVDGTTVTRPAHQVPAGVGIEVAAGAGRYVGRGARKLASALDRFAVEVAGRTAIDVGASTGGFTDVLLQAGAERVVALDVGHGQLHQRLQSDARVTVLEGVNIRHADAGLLGAPFGLIVADLSFISLRTVAKALAELGSDESDWLVLVKPQFEVGPQGIGKGGVVRSAAARARALEEVVAAFAIEGLVAVGAVPSPITGSAGNREALLWLRREGRRIEAGELFKVLADE